jgi:hypothetical protein
MINARTWTFKTALLAAAMTAGLAASATGPAMAQTASLAGNWSGGGRVIYPSGDSERVRCRATFRPAGTRTFRMSAVCATPATRIAQTAQVRRVSASSYSGQFFNREHDISGTINISVRGNRLSASLSGGGGRAIMTLSK